MFKDFVECVQNIYGTKDFIPLHEPRFLGNEKKYLLDTIDSTFVSSVGEYVGAFEKKVAEFTGFNYAVATVNGTSALHAALVLAGVEPDDEVITQSLTFVATCNAIHYCGAEAVFVDVERSTLGLSPVSLRDFLEEYTEIRDDGFCWNKGSGKRIKACVPMNTFGHPVRIDLIRALCLKHGVFLLEDAAESLGSFYNGQHTGKGSDCAVLSFNGNKIITTGGGGMLLMDDQDLAKRAKHITTTAKKAHPYQFDHDEIGFNYRLPNLNAALGVAQMEELPGFLEKKRNVTELYQDWSAKNDVEMISEPDNARSNYWLNALLLENTEQRDGFLEYANGHNVMSRPIWVPMHRLKIYKHCFKTDMRNTEFLSERIVNVPSSVKLDD